jgi:hypothetical protein
MAQIYTENQIIQLLYNECDVCDRIEIEWAIEADSKLSKLYKKLAASRRKLDKLVIEPSIKSINTIMNHASQRELVVS